MTTPYIPESRAQLPSSNANGRARWFALERTILAALERGPMTTTQLKDLGESKGYTRDQIARLVSTQWMDFPRHAGAGRYDPWTIYHPFDPNAYRLGLVHAIDGWLLDFMSGQSKPVPSKSIEEAAKLAGYDTADLSGAYHRCLVQASRRGKKWYRHLDHNDATALAAVRSRAGEPR